MLKNITFFISGLLILASALARSGHAQEDFYIETTVNDKSCSHCPEHLNLIREINKIVEKAPKDLSVAAENKLITEVSKLKFMYYETRTVLENGMVDCQIYNNQSAKHPSGLKKDSLNLLAEEVLGIEKLKSFQIYPQGTEEELRYYYRDTELHSNVVIEVIVKKDHTAIVRYHHYNKDHELPDLGSHLSLIEKDKDPRPSLRLGDEHKLHAEYNLSENQQTIDLDVERNNGEKYVKITSSHQQSGNFEVISIVPREFKLKGDEQLKISTEIANQNSFNYQTQTNAGEAKLRMALTNMNHDYLDVTILSDYEMQKELELRSKFKLGEKSHIEAKFNNDKLGQQDVSVKTVLQVNEKAVVNAGVKQDKNGVEKITLASNVKLSESAMIKNEFNKDSQGAQDASVGSSVKLGEKIKLNGSLYTNEQGKEQVRFSSDVTINENIDFNGKLSRNEKGLEAVSVGSRFTLGDHGNLTTDYSEKYSTNTESLNTVSVGHELATRKSNFKTTASHDTNHKSSFKFQAQKRISENTSMSLSFEHAENNSLLYQFESKF